MVYVEQYKAAIKQTVRTTERIVSRVEVRFNLTFEHQLAQHQQREMQGVLMLESMAE